MSCELHNAVGPCPYCEWAASGDPVKVRSAAARADRVAERPPAVLTQSRRNPDAIPTGPEAENKPFPIASVRKMTQSVTQSPPLPSLPRRAVTFAGAVVRHALAGFPSAEARVKAARLAVCRACPLFRPDGRCGHCGCGMKRKAAWGETECPKGFWPA